MRGTDLTPEQLEAASVFIAGRLLCDVPKPDQTVSHRYEDLVRLVAWYGAIRSKASIRSFVQGSSNPEARVATPSKYFLVKE